MVGYIALKHGFTVPAHRVILFALAIPILATAAVVGLARAASLLGPVGGALGALVVLAGLAVGSFAAHVQWFQRGHPVMRLPGFLAYHTTQAQAMAEAETAGSYVDRAPRPGPRDVMDEALKRLVWDRAGDACEYCRLP